MGNQGMDDHYSWGAVFYNILVASCGRRRQDPDAMAMTIYFLRFQFVTYVTETIQLRAATSGTTKGYS